MFSFVPLSISIRLIENEIAYNETYDFRNKVYYSRLNVCMRRRERVPRKYCEAIHQILLSLLIAHVWELNSTSRYRRLSSNSLLGMASNSFE